MFKKTLQRLMIGEDKLMQLKIFRYAGHYVLQKNLWYLNRRSASRAVFIGLFFAFMPVPLQTIPTIFFCILARANLPLSIGLVWLTNPITMPPVLYLAYNIGTSLLNTPAIPFQLDWDWVMASVHLMWQPLLLGCMILSVSFASTGYVLTELLWRWSIVKRWKKRHHKLAKDHS